MSFESIDIAAAKAELRKSIRAARRELTDERREASAEAVKSRLTALFTELDLLPCNVLAYMPMRYELDVLPAAAALGAMGAKIAFPLCTEGHGLRLLIPAEEEGFRVGAYGILEPVAETAEEIDAHELGAIILPAIGFDRAFNRLGQGGGYYDRLLARASCFTVAVGFDCQLVDRVPCESTDAPVCAIVTPSFTAVRDEIIV